MKPIIFLGFLIISFNCSLTRHSGDVLERKRIFIEGHRGVTEGEKNHNTKEGILKAIDKGIESFETDVWLTADEQLAVFHDLDPDIYSCKDKNINIRINMLTGNCNVKWTELKECVTKEGNYKIPLLENIMKITKGKIFMNLEIKDSADEIWGKIKELIEKYEYYDQISISSFHSQFFQKIDEYNKEYKRTIVFGKLQWTPININYEQLYQISLHSFFLSKDFVQKAHDKGKIVGVWFWPSDPDYYYDLFEMGVDVIISDYPIRVANQLNEYYSDKKHLEGCESIEKTFNIDGEVLTCSSCLVGYELVKIYEEERNLCKLKYELDPDFYKKGYFGHYYQKNIFSIKMLDSPFGDYTICQKNGKTIFYFEWMFGLYGYDNSEIQFLVNDDQIKSSEYSLLNEKQIKKLDFSKIEIYVDNNLVDQNDFLCIDLYNKDYNKDKVICAQCYFIYKGEKKDSYNVEFRLFDDNYISFVTYDNKFLSDKDSWEDQKQ